RRCAELTQFARCADVAAARGDDPSGAFLRPASGQAVGSTLPQCPRAIAIERSAPGTCDPSTTFTRRVSSLVGHVVQLTDGRVCERSWRSNGNAVLSPNGRNWPED